LPETFSNTSSTYSLSNDLIDFGAENINGNMLLTYSIENGNNIDIYVQKVDQNANFMWGTLGNLITSSSSIKSYLSILTSSNGFWIGWWERDPVYKIYLARYNENGSQYWNQPMEIALSNTIVRALDFVSDADDNIYPNWYDDTERNYHIAKIDANQNLLWGNEGITAFSFNNDNEKFYAIQTTPDNEVNFVCVYAVNFYDYYLCFDRFDTSGASILSEPLEINNITSRISYPSLGIYNNSNVFIGWGENDFFDNKIKFQVINDQNLPVLPYSGENLFQGISGSCNNLEIISMHDKSAVFWTIYNDIFLQTIDNNGNKLSEDGIKISGENTVSYNDGYFGYDEINEHILCAWHCNDEETSTISVQAVDETGNLLWGSDGVSVTNSELEQYYPQLSALDGDAYVGWTEYDGDLMNPDFYLYANKINASGDLCWGESGKFLYESTGNLEYEEVLGRLFIWSEHLYPDYSVHAILLDENGNPEPGWEGGKLIATQEGYYFRASGCEVPGGYVIIWRTLEGDDTHIYGQFISDGGEILWDEAGVQLADVLDPTMGDDSKMIYDNALYIDWYDYNDSSNQRESHLQKFDLDGNPIWSDNGIVTVLDTYYHDFLPINNNILVVYTYQNDDVFDVYAKLFSADGEELWETTLCDAEHEQSCPVLSKSGDDNIVISWLDNRIGLYSYSDISYEYTEVYAQNIYVASNYTDDILNAITADLHQNYPNPFNPSTTITFSVPQTALFATIEIYN
ncbi:MAG TPA: hypothetical protein PLD62_10825, partial [Candidatus Cloacimonadota bacterium]|nr:hypothetical protein [Candidatus Cloacimonadota bacterium]